MSQERTEKENRKKASQSENEESSEKSAKTGNQTRNLKTGVIPPSQLIRLTRQTHNLVTRRQERYLQANKAGFRICELQSVKSGMKPSLSLIRIQFHNSALKALRKKNDLLSDSSHRIQRDIHKSNDYQTVLCTLQSVKLGNDPHTTHPPFEPQSDLPLNIFSPKTSILDFPNLKNEEKMLMETLPAQVLFLLLFTHQILTYY